MSNSKNISTNRFRDITRSFLKGELEGEDEEDGGPALLTERRFKNSTVIKEAALSDRDRDQAVMFMLDRILVGVDEMKKRVARIEAELKSKSAHTS
jgi:hypothetical protein